MSSSTTPPVQSKPGRHERLLSVLESDPDPRDRRGVRYPLAGILAVAISAVVAGARSFAAIGQWAVNAKNNEIPARRTPLEPLDLGGMVVTMDAMRTQADTAKLIFGAEADYVFAVKRNMPSLHRKLKDLPRKGVPAMRQSERSRGRRVTRTIKVVDVPD